MTSDSRIFKYAYIYTHKAKLIKEKGATNLHVPLFLNKDTLSGLSKNSDPDKSTGPSRAGLNTAAVWLTRLVELAGSTHSDEHTRTAKRHGAGIIAAS